MSVGKTAVSAGLFLLQQKPCRHLFIEKAMLEDQRRREEREVNVKGSTWMFFSSL